MAYGVTINEVDGQLGVMSAAAATGKMFVIAGPAEDGPLNLPSTYARGKDIQSTFKSGPIVELGAYWIERYGRPVMIVRTGATTEATVSAVTHTATGSTVVTVADDPTATNDAELVVEFLKGGTVGQAGITYKLSHDAGRSWGATRALGTANEIDTGEGVVLELANGTVIAGDVHRVTVTGASFAQADLVPAITALGQTSVPWEIVLFAGGVIDSSLFDVVDAVKSQPNGDHFWLGNVRVPNAGETPAQYAAAMAPLAAAKSAKSGGLGYGAVKWTSAITGRTYRRPAIWSAGPRIASVPEHINVADVDLGSLPGTSIRDANGNPDEHDELIYPGADDMRFITLTTHPRREGVYITLPRTFAPSGSDFDIIPNRRVMNLAREVLNDYLLTVLHKPILVSRKTGLILPSVATRIELGGNAVLATALLSVPKASGARFTVSRTDNLLSLPKLNTGSRILPLAYPRWIDLDMSYENPVLRVQAV